jgi:hypothetical protein
MAEMDLVIDNYSVRDLEKFFKLTSKKYSEVDVDEREYEIREQLLTSGHVNKRLKRDLITFLTEAKRRLIMSLPQENPPTTIPKEAILDKFQIPLSAELPTSRSPFIIERPPTNYINVQTSEFYQGTLNPLNTRTITKYITVDTRFRDKYYYTSSSDFMISLPTKISKVVTMQLTSIELPKDFYSISSKYNNNFFMVKVMHKVNGVGCESSRTIIIPDGNYTGHGLIEQINKILCPIPIDLKSENKYDVFCFLKFNLIESSNRAIFQINLKYPAIEEQIDELILNFGTDINGNNDTKYISSKLGWNMGFVRPIYRGKKEYMSEKPLEPNSIKYIYLAVDDFNKSVNNTFITAFEKSGLKSNILARISMQGTGYENVITNKNYEIITDPRNFFGPVDIQRLHIILYDDHGRILDMNHSDYAFCLKLVIMYDM